MNFFQYDPQSYEQTTIIYGSIPPKSTVSIMFQNGMIFKDGIKLNNLILKENKKIYYGNLSLFRRVNSKLFINDKIRWFYLESITIYDSYIDIIDKQDTDPSIKTDIIDFFVNNQTALEITGGIIILGIIAGIIYVIVQRNISNKQLVTDIRRGGKVSIKTLIPEETIAAKVLNIFEKFTYRVLDDTNRKQIAFNEIKQVLEDANFTPANDKTLDDIVNELIDLFFDS
jgi:hypothetical protein